MCESIREASSDVYRPDEDASLEIGSAERRVHRVRLVRPVVIVLIDKRDCLTAI